MITVVTRWEGTPAGIHGVEVGSQAARSNTSPGGQRILGFSGPLQARGVFKSLSTRLTFRRWQRGANSKIKWWAATGLCNSSEM